VGGVEARRNRRNPKMREGTGKKGNSIPKKPSPKEKKKRGGQTNILGKKERGKKEIGEGITSLGLPSEFGGGERRLTKFLLRQVKDFINEGALTP